MRAFDYSKLNKLKYDSDTIKYIAKINESKGRQELFLRQKPIQLERLINIAKVQSTESSNSIEGIRTTTTRIKQLLGNKVTPKNRDEEEIVGYRDVLELIHENYNEIKITPNYILQLHKILLSYTNYSYGGNFKSVQNYINETLSDGTEITKFTPLSPYETPEAIMEICKSYYRVKELELVDPLILIPAFIADFLCIHPFNDGNGRMSRLLTLVLLYQNGFIVGKYISIEKQIEKTKDVYYDVLEMIDQGWHEEKNDPTPYIKYFLQVVLACYREFEERVGVVEDAGVKSSVYDIVKAYVVSKIGKIKSADVISDCTRGGRSQILESLKRLVEEGILEKRGTGRSTYYVKIDKDNDLFRPM